jgi:polyhydroxyalkanoate synthesis regulator protein
MDAFRGQQQQLRGAVEQAIAANPFVDMAKRNMELFAAATSAFRPRSNDADKDAEISALKAEIEGLKATIAHKG